MRKLLSALTLMPSLAVAASGAFHNTGTLASLPGYGYAVSGSYESSIGDFTLDLNVVDRYQYGSAIPHTGAYELLGLAATMSLTGSVPDDAQASIKLSLSLSFVNLATGQPGLPAEFYTPGGMGYPQVFFVGGGGASSAISTKPGVISRTGQPSLSEQLDVFGDRGPVGLYECYVDAIWHDDFCRGNRSDTVSINYSASFSAGDYRYQIDPNCRLDCELADARDRFVVYPLQLGFSVLAVPEPATAAMFVGGLAALILRRRGARSRQSAGGSPKTVLEAGAFT